MKIVRVVGQLEVHLRSNKAVKQGFRTENGRLVKYTKDGRKRNHWLNHFRHISRRHLKEECENRKCFAVEKLTIHHKIALNTAKTEKRLMKLCEEENCQTLCQKCHTELEIKRALKRNKKIKEGVVVVSGKLEKDLSREKVGIENFPFV